MTSIRELIKAVGDGMRAHFEEISRQVPHMGERGRSREEIVRAFLSDYAPGRIGVGHGIIVDHNGATSPECDVILYDAHSTPVFRVSDSVRLFPAETVFLVIQVKSNLTKPELKSAIDNLAAVSRLKRSAEPPEPMLAGYNMRLFTGEEGILAYHPPPIPGGIFAFNSTSVDNVASNMLHYCRSRPRFEWPAFIVSLSRGTIVYARAGPSSEIQASVGAPGNDQVLVSGNQEHHPLLMLYLFVVSRCQNSLSATPNLFSYLGIRSFHSKSIPI